MFVHRLAGRSVLALLLLLAGLLVSPTQAQPNRKVRPAFRPSNSSKLSQVSGTLVSVSSTTAPAVVTITLRNSTTATVNVTTSTKIILNGQASTLAALAALTVTTRVEAQVNSSNNAYALEAYVVLTPVYGTLAGVNTTTGVVSVQPKTGSPVSVTVTASTKLIVNGQTGTLTTLAALPATATVKALVDSAGNAYVLEASIPLTRVYGTLTSVSSSTAPASVVITEKNSTTAALTVSATTTIILNGQASNLAALAALTAKTTVAALVDSSNNAYVLQANVVLTPVHGTYSSFSSPTLTITLKSGGTSAVSITGTTKIYINGQLASSSSALSGLPTTDYVSALVDSNGNAYVVNVGTKSF